MSGIVKSAERHESPVATSRPAIRGVVGPPWRESLRKPFPSRSSCSSTPSPGEWAGAYLEALVVDQLTAAGPPSHVWGRAAVRVVAAVAEVIGELALERGLDQPLGQLGQQPALTGQHKALRAGPPDQAVDQLLVDGVENIRPGSLRRSRLVTSQCVEIHHRLGHQFSHRCQSP